jgi:hypothetical protein
MRICQRIEEALAIAKEEKAADPSRAGAGGARRKVVIRAPKMTAPVPGGRRSVGSGEPRLPNRWTSGASASCSKLRDDERRLARTRDLRAELQRQERLTKRLSRGVTTPRLGACPIANGTRTSSASQRLNRC